MNEIRCKKCNRCLMLAYIVYGAIKCGKCGYINHLVFISDELDIELKKIMKKSVTNA